MREFGKYGIEDKCTRTSVVISGEKEHLEDTNVDGNITIKWMLKKYMGGNRVG